MLMPRYMGLNDSTSSSGKNASSSSSSNGSPATMVGVHTTVAAHTKMRLLNKVEHNIRQSQGQSQNINSLISTAATGNGVVGDVDGLLMPMRITEHHSPPPADVPTGPGVGGAGPKNDVGVHTNSRPERNLWSRPEMLEMLSIMQNINALERLHDRNTKSEHVFRQVEMIMRSKGYVKKSSIQIWTKWKFLKSTYNTTTRYGTGVPKVVPEEVYRVLCRMLGGGDGHNVSGSLSECGNSMDSSKTMGEEDEMGVEHPIFGFRLGLVKPEPIDTGYETAPKDVISEPDLEAFNHEVHDRGDPDYVPHMPIIVSVKHEPDVDLGMDDTNTPPPTAPASPTPPPVSVELNEELNEDSNHVYTPSPTMPPLRVASFAKDELKRPTHGILQIDRPPPSLTQMGPLPGQHDKGTRSMSLQSTSSINFVHPTSKLMLPRKQPVRLSREISVQPAGMRLKSVPMRETGYSLRPERMIPDLGHSISPPQSPTPSPPIYSQNTLRGPPPRYPMPPQAPSTSRQAQCQSQQQPQQRKRRMAQNQGLAAPPVPVKLQRSSMVYESTPKNSRSAPQTEAQSTPEDIRNSKEEQKERRKRQHEDLFTKELTQLANGMRMAQKEMLEDFFKQQRKFARSEHLFQMKQDSMVMTALRKQTDALLQVANELIGDNHTPKMEKKETITEEKSEKKDDKTEANEKKAEENEDADDDDGGDSENEEDNEDEDEEDEEEFDDEENMNFESEMDMCTMAMSESAKSHSLDGSSHGDAHSEVE